MPLIHIAIAAVFMAIIGILIRVVYTRAVAAIASAHIITDAMGQRVIAIDADAVGRALLDRHEQATVALRSAVSNDGQPSDFLCIRRIRETQNAPVLGI